MIQPEDILNDEYIKKRRKLIHKLIVLCFVTALIGAVLCIVGGIIDGYKSFAFMFGFVVLSIFFLACCILGTHYESLMERGKFYSLLKRIYEDNN